MDKETYLKLQQWRDQIQEVDYDAEKKAAAHWDSIAKPLDGLGLFEKTVSRMAAMMATEQVEIKKPAVCVMCADNGIVQEGVSQSTEEVTALVAKSMLAGKANINRMASYCDASVLVVDIGMLQKVEDDNLLNWNVRRGSRNFLQEPAMTEEEVCFAIAGGVELVRLCKEKGFDLLCTGEMGIGNTTTSTAMAAKMLELSPEELAGTGAGLDEKGLKRKKEVLKEAFQKYQIEHEETLKILCTFGGYDLAGLVGVYLGGAIYRIPVIIDGLIAATAALTAERLFPGTKRYMIASHMGKEKGMQAILQELALEPVIYGNLALGEGTGAVMMIPLLQMALRVYNGNTQFSDIDVEKYERYEEL